MRQQVEERKAAPTLSGLSRNSFACRILVVKRKIATRFVSKRTSISKDRSWCIRPRLGASHALLEAANLIRACQPAIRTEGPQSLVQLTASFQTLKLGLDLPIRAASLSHNHNLSVSNFLPPPSAIYPRLRQTLLKYQPFKSLAPFVVARPSPVLSPHGAHI